MIQKIHTLQGRLIKKTEEVSSTLIQYIYDLSIFISGPSTCIYPSIHSLNLSISAYIHPSIILFVCPSINLCIHLPSLHLSVYPSINLHLCIHQSIHPIYFSSINSFIHMSLLLSNYVLSGWHIQNYIIFSIFFIHCVL